MSPHASSSLRNWLSQIANTIIPSILRNTLPNGAIRASPSTSHPDYSYHWVRDAALCVSFLSSAYARNPTSELLSTLERYIDLETQNTYKSTRTGLGEPKFHLDGAPYTLPWARPQNDSPALRVLAMISILPHLDDNKQADTYYKAILPSLHYISQTHTLESYDPWEEIRAHNFYTSSVVHSALLKGASLAERFNDTHNAEWFKLQSQFVRHKLEWFKTGNGLLQPHVPIPAHKPSRLDAQVIVAALHAPASPYQPHSKAIHLTMTALADTFGRLYAINRQTDSDGTAPAIGRYPEDTYDGYETTSLGNPWPLLTCAFAEVHYRTAAYHMSLHSVPSLIDVQAAQDELDKGDAYLRRLRKHLPKDTELGISEQWNRETGFMQGANNLTWSFVALASAGQAREEIVAVLEDMQYRPIARL
ncbi:hypothetical protein HDU85_001176 [Gaertneriomyces sp. JEL0708]|nr:hypothetical protein HDU85_001176 [Gaertneriomyces sp. JEL0708]